MGINKEMTISNLKKYREISGEDTISDNEIINSYLDMCTIQ